MYLSIERHDGGKIAAITDRGETLTYGELRTFVPTFRDAVQGRPLVFLFCENSLGALMGYVAALDGGIVPLLLDVNMDAQLRDALIETYHPSYIWAPEEYAQTLPYPQSFAARGYSLRKTELSPYPLHEELALLITTSGSTGSPKLVRQSVKNLESNARSIVQYLEITEQERAITPLPMNYVYGLSIINSHLMAGAMLLMTTSGVLQKAFWQFFKAQGSTSMAGVPYTYEMLKKLRIFRMELPSLKTLTQAGGKLVPELHREYAQWTQETGRKFVVMYGAAEATARMGYLPFERSLEKFGSMGIAIPGGELWLEDAQGNVIEATGTVGELCYCGDNVTLGYAERGEDLAKGDERGGVLRTGDMATRDDDGYYTIVGRKKRFLKMFGNRVSLDEVERMIKREFEIDCACGGSDDNLAVYIASGDVQVVRALVAGKTGLHPSAISVRAVAEIPKNEAGKTLYSKLEELD